MVVRMAVGCCPAVHQCAAACGSVPQCAAVCGSVRQCAAVCGSACVAVQQCVAARTAVCGNVRQCAQCSSVQQCSSAHGSVLYIYVHKVAHNIDWIALKGAVGMSPISIQTSRSIIRINMNKCDLILL
jgi:hypothetical protein